MGHKILLADDSITIQKVIELTFSDEDFELHTVGNGQKAIDEIRSILPDVVLCDIIMPEKNGYEVCEFIKTSDDLKHIPVLLLTGAFEPFDQERAKAAGCNGFLAKPFEPQTLIAKVKELLASTAGAATQQAAAQAAAEAPTAAPTQPAPAPPSQPAPPDASSGEETVFAAPPPLESFGAPTPPASMEDATLGQGFVAEAGERELSLGPEDRTVLLGQNDSAPVPPPTASEDIWGQVAAPPPDAEDEAATIFMAGPPPVANEASEPASSGSGATTEMNDPDTTWQMSQREQQSPPASPASTPPGAPGPEAQAQPQAQPLPDADEPTGDFGGFEEFAAAASEPETPSHASEPTPQQEFGAFESAAPPEPTPPTPEVPFVAESAVEVDAESSDPFPPLEPMDMDVGAGGVSPLEPADVVQAEGGSGAPLAAESTTPTPQGQDAGAAAGAPSAPTSDELSTDFDAFMPAQAAGDSPAPGGEMVFEPPPPAGPSGSSEPEPPPPTPAKAPEPAPPAQPPAAAARASTTTSTEGVDDDLVERVAQRVVDKLSAKIIQEIAWEVVPDLAEGLIKREIDALKAKIPE
jgi:CheY-like chemotaxis protein